MFSFVGNLQTAFQSGRAVLNSHHLRVREIVPTRTPAGLGAGACAATSHLPVPRTCAAGRLHMHICHPRISFDEMSVWLSRLRSVGLFVFLLSSFRTSGAIPSGSCFAEVSSHSAARLSFT